MRDNYKQFVPGSCTARMLKCQHLPVCECESVALRSPASHRCPWCISCSLTPEVELQGPPWTTSSLFFSFPSLSFRKRTGPRGLSGLSSHQQTITCPLFEQSAKDEEAGCVTTVGLPREGACRVHVRCCLIGGRGQKSHWDLLGYTLLLSPEGCAGTLRRENTHLQIWCWRQTFLATVVLVTRPCSDRSWPHEQDRGLKHHLGILIKVNMSGSWSSTSQEEMRWYLSLVPLLNVFLNLFQSYHLYSFIQEYTYFTPCLSVSMVSFQWCKCRSLHNSCLFLLFLPCQQASDNRMFSRLLRRYKQAPTCSYV